MNTFLGRFLLVASMLTVQPVVAAELTVSAASSLTDAFKAIATAYEGTHPGTRIILNLGASGLLLQQLDSGAPVDVLATADADTMDKARAKGLLIDDTRADFARNALVLIAPVADKAPVRSLGDLANPAAARIAISNPDTVPVGKYTRDALQARGLWAVVEPKMISTQNVRQSLDYVVRGEVDAGFVYATDARLVGDKVRLLETVPTAQPIVYPIAVVRSSKEPVAAQDFATFVRSAAARQILVSFGFQEY